MPVTKLVIKRELLKFLSKNNIYVNNKYANLYVGKCAVHVFDGYTVTYFISATGRHFNYVVHYTTPAEWYYKFSRMLFLSSVVVSTSSNNYRYVKLSKV